MKYDARLHSPGSAVLAAMLALGLLAAGAAAQTGKADVPAAEIDSQEAVRLSRTGTFEIHVQGADLRGVLQLLSTQGRRNIIATKEVSGDVTADLYGVTFQEALDAVMRSSGYVYEQEGNFIYVYTPEQLAAIRRSERQRSIRTKVFRLAYLTAADAETLITPAISDDGTVAVGPAAATGITTSDSEAGGNSSAAHDVLVVRDYEENLQRVTEILEELDVRPEQVLIEATILRATLTEDNDMGIDFNALAGVDFESMNSTTTGYGSISPEASTTYDGRRAASFHTDMSASVPDGGLTIGVITNNVSMFIRALESVTDTTIVANPKLLVLNKQRAEVMIGSRSGYLTTTITETVASQTVEFLETGTRLVVRPYIGKNGYIRMEIHPEDSDGGVEISEGLALPNETTTETTQNVLIRDGRTIVIGGLFRERTTNGRSQIPVLGNIPYLGVLFRGTNDGIEREEVIILVTPHIITHDSDEPTSEQIKDDIERFRVGQRKGLRWWGRSRLAQTHMRWARQELLAGRRDKALWNVDMALSLNPKMIEAVHLKERLTDRAYWADEHRISTAKYVVQQMVMQELGKPVERIVPPDKPLKAKDVEPEVREKLGIAERYFDPLPMLPPQMLEAAKDQSSQDSPEKKPVKPEQKTEAKTEKPAE